MKNFLIGVCFLFLFSFQEAYSRWAKPEEASFVIESATESFNIHADGTFEREQEQFIRILTEEGREQWTFFSLTYCKESEDVTIITAECKDPETGKLYPVTKNLIEDKTFASGQGGFDDLRRLSFAFPNVRVGSIVHFKIGIKSKVPNVPQHFSTILEYGQGAPLVSHTLTVTSELPLNFVPSGPSGFLKVTQMGPKKWQVHLEQPAFQRLVHEGSAGILPEDRIRLLCTTFNRWDDLARIMSEKYFKAVLTSALPSSYAEIAQHVASEKNEIDQLNGVTAHLQDLLVYMGDWRTVKGRLAPRPFNTVLSHRHADCKDFATATAAILKSLGYDAYVVLVSRGHDYVQGEHPLPMLTAFNHAIVKVIGRDGKTVYWIDPTNSVSMAGHLFPDIANRQALVLGKNSQGGALEQIPPVDSKMEKMEIVDEITFLNSEERFLKGRVSFSRGRSFFLQEDLLRRNKELVLPQLLLSISNDSTVLDKPHQIVIEEIPAKQNLSFSEKIRARIVEDMAIRYAYRSEKDILKVNTPTGIGTFLSLPFLSSFINLPLTQEGYTLLESPHTWECVCDINGVEAEHLENFNTHYESPWINISLKAERHNDEEKKLGLMVKIELLKGIVTPREIRSQAYQDLVKFIKSKLLNKAFVYSHVAFFPENTKTGGQ